MVMLDLMNIRSKYFSVKFNCSLKLNFYCRLYLMLEVKLQFDSVSDGNYTFNI
jgi:hypothetical protein